MSEYKPVTQKDADIFLQLYKKYLDFKFNKMENILKELPTDLIERSFNGVVFYKEGFDISKINETKFGNGGLCGYGVIMDLVYRLEDIYNKYDDPAKRGYLEDTLKGFGHKVNFKKLVCERTNK